MLKQSITDPKFYPHYQVLSNVSKSLYQTFYQGIFNGERKIATPQGGSPDDVKNAYNALYYDHPELCWLEGGYSFKSRDGQVFTVSPNYNSLARNLSHTKQKLDEAHKSFLEGVAGKTIYEAELIAHDRMVNQISYKKNSLDQTAYAALVNKQAICAGYSRAFQLLMHSLMIPCYFVSGDATPPGKRKSLAHAWNILCIQGEYYNLDLTWDDCFDKQKNGLISYNFFNCTDQKFASSHRRDEISSILPNCNGTRFAYKN